MRLAAYTLTVFETIQIRALKGAIVTNEERIPDEARISYTWKILQILGLALVGVLMFLARQYNAF